MGGPTQTFIYKTVFKKYSTIALFAVGTAFVWERFINVNIDQMYNNINKGVSQKKQL